MSGSWKTRSFATARVSGRARATGFHAWSDYEHTIGNTETRYSLSHSRSGGRWSGGGPFYLDRSITMLTPDSVNVDSNICQGTAHISTMIGTNPVSIPSFDARSNSELDAMGATAIARTEPTNPAFDLATAIGELRAEGLPKLPGSTVREQTRLAKSAGGEFLNIEFGWLPLVRNVRDFATTVKNSDDILRQYQEGSHKVIQRSYEWPAEESSQAFETKFAAYPSQAGQFSGGGRHNFSSRKTWFEVEYIYYLPTGGSINDKFRRYGSYARKLLGVDLSPEVLWNLSPWSWAADWFSNTGDVMHNISALGTDGLVLRNGYIMCHTRDVRQSSGQLQGQHQVRVNITETKTRRGATPYGFGVAYAGLTTKQKAIAAAVGLSRW
nr:MAG: hypothetical protein 1 [Leviviridae sp.]